MVYNAIAINSNFSAVTAFTTILYPFTIILESPYLNFFIINNSGEIWLITFLLITTFFKPTTVRSSYFKFSSSVFNK